MTPLLIYTPQNGLFLKSVLDGVATLLNTDTFASAVNIMMIFAVSCVGYQYVMGKKLAALSNYFVVTFFVSFCVLGMRVPVAIIDMQWADGAGEALTVDNVPLGIALPASIISGLGYGITQTFSDVFHMPADLDYNKTGMIFGARTWLSASRTGLSQSPDLSADMSAYIRQCIFSAKLLASQQLTPAELVNSAKLIKTYFNNPSPVYRVVLQDGKNVSCREAAANLKTRLPKAALRELERLGHMMAAENHMSAADAKFSGTLAAAHDYYMGISTSAAEILTQNMLINATRDAARDAFAFVGADAALMNYTNTDSMQKMHIAEANSFWLASFRLPYYMTVMWMLTLCIFPLVALIAYFPVTPNVFGIYLKSQAYLWSWPPMFIIIHFFVSLASQSTLTIFGQKTGGGVTFSNIDAIASMHSNFAYTAGALAASVPFLAYYITKGLGSILSTASQHFGGMAQSLSVGEAQSVAQGNVSMASYSGWNMNYDNHNAHKFDTNKQHAEGRSTIQMGNGALLTQNGDGTTVGNIQPAISSAAVSVHGSSRVVDALNQSASQSFSNANQLRTSADTHLQEGLNKMENFTETDTNDTRSGMGVSNTTTNSIGEDLRIMKDAVQHYNKHHDVSGHVSAEAAITERMSTNKQFVGKALEVVTGGSIEGSITGRTQGSTNHSVQWFNNSSEGQAFNKAFHHMVSTAENSHLDTADSKNLSGADQIGASFAKSHALLSQASSEYSKGEQLSNAATHAREDASSIDKNLNQAYHDWVIARHGDEGERLMLQVDSASIAKQEALANEFLNSGTGRSAIANQVNSALSKTGADVRAGYNQNAAKISQSSHIVKHYNNDIQKVDGKATTQGLTEMSTSHLLAGKAIQSAHRQKSLTENASSVKTTVKGELNNINQEVTYKKLNKETK